MPDAYTKFAAAAGDVPSTPGIAPTDGPPPAGLGNYWARVWWDLRHPLGWLAEASATAGVAASGVKVSPKAAERIEEHAATHPLEAPLEAGKAAIGLGGPGWTAGLQQWVQQQGKIVGIYTLFVIVGLVGLVFLLSAAGTGVSVGPVRVGK